MKTAGRFRLTTKGRAVVIFLIGMLVVGLYLLISRPNPIDQLSLTYLDSLTKDSLGYSIPASYDEAYSIADYTMYGESMVLYHEPYGTSDYDELYGRNVTLKNVETGMEQTFTFAGGADSGIPLGQLEPGVYEIYVYDGYTRKRAYMENALEADPFITMRRNKEITSINLVANKNYLRKLGTTQDKNYLYLTVTSSLPKVKIVDVVIDPSGLETYANSTIYEPGYQSDLINEAAAGYQFAQEIRAYLQEAGLRVEITRTSNEPNSYYGSESRVSIGYAKQAKVFLGLTMGNGDYDRPYLLSSPYTNGQLANAMVHTLIAQGIELYDIPSTSTMTDPGSGMDRFTETEKGKTKFSIWPQLRETGGKVTYTGTGSQYLANADFQNKYGMYGILFVYASADSENSQTYFLTHEGSMAQAIAQGILNYFDIPQKEESSV